MGRIGARFEICDVSLAIFEIGKLTHPTTKHIRAAKSGLRRRAR
jgi:hypothetical protein